MDSFMGIDKDMWNIGLKINKDEKDELRTNVTQLEAENAALREALRELVEASLEMDIINLECYGSSLTTDRRNKAFTKAQALLEAKL
jgi:hypothetical protein